MKALVYCRTSVDDNAKKQDESALKQSIRTQDLQGRKYCQAQGYEVLGVFSDSDVSGTLVCEERPAFKKMLKLFPEADALVVQDSSRLARTDFVAQGILKYVDDYGLDLLGWLESIDIKSPHGRMVFSIIGSVNNFQVAKTRELSVLNKYEKAKAGKFLHMPSSFGYRRTGSSSCEVVPEEAEIVTTLFKMAKTEKLTRIVSWLNNSGIKTRRGGDWNLSKLKSILGNRMYTGFIDFMIPQKKKGDKRVSEVFPCPAPPIINEETFVLVQDALKSRSVRQTRIGIQLLSQVIHCGYCIANGHTKKYTRGGSIKGKVNSRTEEATTKYCFVRNERESGSFYRCYRRIAGTKKSAGWKAGLPPCKNHNAYQDIVEPALLSIVKSFAFAAAHGRFRVKENEDDLGLSSLKAQEILIKQELSELVDIDIKDMRIVAARFEKRSQELEQIEKEISRIKDELSLKRSSTSIVEVRNEWEALSAEQKNDVIYDVCKVIAFRSGVLIQVKDTEWATHSDSIFLPYERRFPEGTVRGSGKKKKRYVLLPHEKEYGIFCKNAIKDDPQLMTFYKATDSPASSFTTAAEFKLLSESEKAVALVDDGSNRAVISSFVRSQMMWAQLLTPIDHT